MTARLVAARIAVLNTVRMYAPVHQNFSAEAERQLYRALADVESAAVEAHVEAHPVAPIDPRPPLPPVTFNPPPTPDAVGEVSHPAPLPLETPPEVAAVGVPPSPEEVAASLKVESASKAAKAKKPKP